VVLLKALDDYANEIKCALQARREGYFDRIGNGIRFWEKLLYFSTGVKRWVGSRKLGISAASAPW
jgi:hypothetical protein